MGREECEAVICAGGVFDIVDWLCVAEDGNMSMGKLRERAVMMASGPSSSVKMAGAWSEFAVVGMAILITMCLPLWAS